MINKGEGGGETILRSTTVRRFKGGTVTVNYSKDLQERKLDIKAAGEGMES